MAEYRRASADKRGDERQTRPRAVRHGVCTSGKPERRERVRFVAESRRLFKETPTHILDIGRNPRVYQHRN
jgi:hypothetical protein